jgi:pyridoxamine 5'-phosphate oxidase
MKENPEISSLRKEYKLRELSEKNVDENPFEQFDIWFKEMLDSKIPEPTAMILATATKEGKPSARTLLLKAYNKDGFTFYTNYESRKGKEIEENNSGALLFFWPELERQIRIEGTIKKLSQSTSNDYFKTRPYKSRIGAWASKQSSVIPDRAEIIKKFFKYLLKFHSRNIPLPDFWGGYILIPDLFEFWQGRASRLHDRVSYRKETGKWIIERLSP